MAGSFLEEQPIIPAPQIKDLGKHLAAGGTLKWTQKEEITFMVNYCAGCFLLLIIFLLIILLFVLFIQQNCLAL